MSDGNYAMGAGQPQAGHSDDSSMAGTVKDEAADLKDTATDAAKDVAGTAKHEAAAVVGETKAQAKELFLQTQRELSDQAASQQRRVAAGLGSLGEELSDMARDSTGSGIAADLVQQVATRASGAAAWLDSRDPAGVLQDVKLFARRRPIVFIGAALVAGIAAGRLTRALIANARDEAASSPTEPAALSHTATPAVPAYAAPPASAEDSPLYAESAARRDTTGGEVPNERSDTF